VDGCVGAGAGVGFFEGSPGVPALTQVPLEHEPNGIELQGVESGTYCGDGQLPSGLQDTASLQSLSLPHKHSCSDACLYVQYPSCGYSSPSRR